MASNEIISTIDVFMIIGVMIIPILGSAVLLVNRNPGWSGVLTTLLSLGVFVLTLVLITRNWGSSRYMVMDWFATGAFSFQAGFLLDNLSMMMLVVVSLIALLVNIFSITYMEHDEGRNRYFLFLGLFAFSMYGIVLSSNVFLTFFFWELVGFSSYLLIGFWYKDQEPPRASFKAFIINRIGDSGFLIGLFVLFAYFGSFELPYLGNQFPELVAESNVPLWALYTLGIGLFLGAIGKSAQFPLQTWLPDAMAGPTPVSALIHAATMVAAGVFLLIRIFPLLIPELLPLLAFIGALTGFMGAFAAMAQKDMKRVLAFSTISQLGYMVMAVGVGAPQLAFFHLLTHAFFKACLFLCAGSIIHFMHNTNHHGDKSQFMSSMGGLKNFTPVTFVAYTISMLALCGLPLFSGYFSKEAVLIASVNWDFVHQTSGIGILVPVLALLTVLMTAIYMGRQYFLVFFGEARFEITVSSDGSREPLLFRVPLVVLATLSLWFFYQWNPLASVDFWPVLALETLPADEVPASHGWLAILSTSLGLIGLTVSYFLFYRKQFSTHLMRIDGALGQLSLNNWYMDTIYDATIVRVIHFSRHFLNTVDQRLVDGLVNAFGIIGVVTAQIAGWFDKYILDGMVYGVAFSTRGFGKLAKSFQGGNVQAYFAWAMVGILMTLFFLVI